MCQINAKYLYSKCNMQIINMIEKKITEKNGIYFVDMKNRKITRKKKIRSTTKPSISDTKN